MSCGEVKQNRIAEMITFSWDASGNLLENPLTVGDNVDLGGGNTVGVSITVCSATLEAGVSADFTVQTAPINAESFFTDLKVAGSSVTLPVNQASKVVFESVQGFSRFFSLGVPATLTGPVTLASSVTVTIDVVVRA